MLSHSKNNNFLITINYRQTKALETYRNHQLSLTSLVCFVGTLQAIAVTFVMEHRAGAWKVGWDMNLLAAAYAVIIPRLPLSKSIVYECVTEDKKF